MAASHCQGHCSGPASASVRSKPDKGLEAFWNNLPLQQRRHLCSIPRRTLFEAIRNRYCSRCFGLFALRYEELRCSNGTPESDGCPACKACPACQDFFLGLEADAKSVFLEESMLQGSPFDMFAQSKAREQERDLQFMTAGDVCGSGFNARRNGKVCALHTTRVSPETLLAYWGQLPAEHCTALFSLPRHDFEAELDSCCSMQLRICKDCRYNVLAQYKLALSAGRKAAGHSRASTDEDSSRPASGGGSTGREAAPGTPGGSRHEDSPACSSGGLTAIGDAPAAVGSRALALVPAQPLLPVCEGFSLRVTDATVELVGTDAAMLLEEAEEIEDLKGDDGGEVRHAETPELAQEALIDAVILIFKAQVEVAFREQTAGHNALLLLVALSHELLEERLRNAYLDVHARAAEAELLELVAEDEKRLAARSSRSRRRKKGSSGGTPPAANTPQQAAEADGHADAPRPGSDNGAAAPIDDAAPSTPRKAERALPVAPDWSEDASPCERPPPCHSTPDAGDEQDLEWEVQQRGRKSRRGSRQPDQGRPSASPSPLGEASAGAAAARARAQTPPPPPPPLATTSTHQTQLPGHQQHSGWASVVSGAASTPMDAAASWSTPALPAPHQHDKPLTWPQLPTIRPQPASPVVPPPQPIRLRPDSQQQPMAPGSRQPPPGFAVRMPHSAPQQQQQPQPPRPGASVSRRSSTEYSLWGEDSSSRVPLSLSASRESLASASDMSFGSPPLAGGHVPTVAAAGPGGPACSALPAGGVLGKQAHNRPPSAAVPSLFQHFGLATASAQPPSATPSASVLPFGEDDGFSLFSSFPAASSQHAGSDTSGGSAGAWHQAGFSSMFGGSSILGPHKTMAQVMLA